MLERKGCSFHSSDGVMEVRRNGAVVMKGRRNGSLYYLCGSAKANVVKAESTEVWHMRLGHPAIGSIRELVKREVIHGAGEMPAQPCEECILG